MARTTYRTSIPDADRITPQNVFFNRRQFVKTTAMTGILPPLFCGIDALGAAQDALPRRDPLDLPFPWPPGFAFETNDHYELPAGIAQDLTPRRAAATHNNYYEFLMGRGGEVWRHTEKFDITPWKIEVSGECNKPATFDLDDLFAFEQEERLYHFRCVERWAMNVPWIGFPLRALLARVEPNGHATHVRFLTVHRPEQMPGLSTPTDRGFQWPYHEGLRLDEAMNELTLLATGLYGEPLLKQHGAPVRLVVPWKYGYKNPKSIVKIELVREQPRAFWSTGLYAHEYGFLSNVNPDIPHPRWSQSKSHWVDTKEQFDTPVFNGYGSFVANLYPDEPMTLQTPLKRGEIAR